MPLPVPVNSVNDAPCKVQEVLCNCDLLWSLAHQFAYLRLSIHVDENRYRFVQLYAARARRIAATYARFYLEIEEGGAPRLKGRYYWMALGAFASKTVACLLDAWQIQTGYVLSKSVANGLAKGNLWLFSDIASSHWFYNNYRGHFTQGMGCHKRRDASTLERAVKGNLDALPWASDALAKMRRFTPSEDIIEAFTRIEAFEAESSPDRRRQLQFEHLIAVANHEQGAVLQPLIYEDEDFRWWTKTERDWLWWASPKYQITFTHKCDAEKSMKSEASGDMEVEDFESRMNWIVSVAEQFHELMHRKASVIEDELKAIAGWVNSPDAKRVY